MTNFKEAFFAEAEEEEKEQEVKPVSSFKEEFFSDPYVVESVALEPEIDTFQPREALPTDLKFAGFDTGIELDKSTAATLVGIGHGMQDTFQGVKQLLGIADEDYAEEQQYLRSLYDDPELGTEATVGRVGGMIADPAAVVTGGMAALKVADVATDVIKMSKLAKSSKFATNSAFAGAGWGAVGYVDEEAGEDRLSNAAMGALLGGLAGYGVGKATQLSEVKAARESFSEANDVMDAFRQRVMEEARDSNVLLPAIKKVKSEDPDLFNRAMQARNGHGLAFNFRNGLQDRKLVDEVNTGKYPADSSPQRRNYSQNGLVSTLDKYLGILSTRVENVSPQVAGRLKRMEAQLLMRPEKLVKVREDFANYFPSASSREITNRNVVQFQPEQITALNKYLVNGDFDRARQFIRAYRGEDAAKAFDKSREVLDELGKEMKELGIINKELDNYWPRVVNRERVEDYIKSKNKGKSIDSIIKTKNKELTDKRGFGMSPMEESSFIQKMLYKEGSDVSVLGSAKSRTIPKVSDKMIKFYDDPIEAMDSYIHNAVAEIEKAKFFSPEVYQTGAIKQGEFDLDKAIDGLQKDNVFSKLDKDDQVELRELLKARFGKQMQMPSKWIQNYKAIVNSTLLANPVSAATQLGDLGMAMYKNGVGRSAVGFFNSLVQNKDRITIQDLGLEMSRYAEFEDLGATARKRYQDFFLKWSGFSAIDRIGKETFVNGALARARDLAKKDQSSQAYRVWSNKYKEAWGNDEFYQLRKELLDYKKGEKPSDRVLTYVFNELSDFQPISKSEMPATYAGNNKFWYTLKSFMLKQMDIVRRDIINNARSGDRDLQVEAAKNLGQYLALVGGMNMGVEAIKSEVLGKPEENPFAKMEDSLGNITASAALKALGMTTLKVFNINDFALSAIEKDVAKGTFDLMLPPAPIISEAVRGVSAYARGEDPSEKLSEITRYFPLIGRNWDARYIPGLWDERDQAEDVVAPEIEAPEIQAFAEGGLVEANPEVEKIIDEAVVATPEEIKETEQDTSGIEKLEPGIYQDAEGNLFQVTEYGKLVDVEEKLGGQAQE